MTAGTLQDYGTHGRKRLLPWFGELRLVAIDEDRVRGWLAEMVELSTPASSTPRRSTTRVRVCR